MLASGAHEHKAVHLWGRRTVQVHLTHVADDAEDVPRLVSTPTGSRVPK